MAITTVQQTHKWYIRKWAMKCRLLLGTVWSYDEHYRDVTCVQCCFISPAKRLLFNSFLRIITKKALKLRIINFLGNTLLNSRFHHQLLLIKAVLECTRIHEYMFNTDHIRHGREITPRFCVLWYRIKWLFCRHSKMYIHTWKYLNFDSNFIYILCGYYWR